MLSVSVTFSLLSVLWNLQPRRADLDMNQHVNNVTYIGWLLEVSTMRMATKLFLAFLFLPNWNCYISTTLKFFLSNSCLCMTEHASRCHRHPWTPDYHLRLQTRMPTGWCSWFPNKCRTIRGCRTSFKTSGNKRLTCHNWRQRGQSSIFTLAETIRWWLGDKSGPFSVEKETCQIRK